VVGFAGLRLGDETGANAAVVVVAMLATATVLVLFAIDTARNEPRTFVAMLAVGVVAALLDLLWKRQRGRPASPAMPGADAA
jgi:hypothetical protein